MHTRAHAWSAPNRVRRYEPALTSVYLDWVDSWGNLLSFPETYAARLEVKTDAQLEVSIRRTASRRSLQVRSHGNAAALVRFRYAFTAMQAAIRGTKRG
jgi:hypothetical protein